MSQGYYGNTTGPGPSYFRAYIEYRTTAQEETRAWVQRKFSIQVTAGNFNGSIMDRSWGDRIRVYGTGWYGDSGWQDVGWIDYGASHSSSANASYTSGSVGYLVSNVSATYKPDVPTWTPKAPTGISVSRKSNAQNVVSWARNATTARPYANIYVERSVDGGAWSQIAALGGTAASYTDNSTSANHRYAYRVRARNSAGYSDYNTSGWAHNTPNAPGSCTNTRNGDTSNTVRWSLGSSDTGLYSGHKIERQVNGGSWTQIATVGAGTTSYTDTTAAANNYYAYRVRSYNGAGDSGYATSGTTYNTPAAPGKPAMARTSDTGVQGTFSNGANTATALEVQRSADRSTWVAVSSVSGKVTTFADNPGGGTFYYRIRNTHGSLVSGWVVSDAIVTICAPSAPTVTAPASSAVVPKSQTAISVRWRHNPIDGSAQTAAQVRWSTDNGSTWNSATVNGGSASYSLANSFAVNATVNVQVRTKGAHADYGPWSASRMFFVYQVPTVTVEQPANGFVAENMPIHVRIAYSDPSGTLAAAAVTFTIDGEAVYTRDATRALEFDVLPSEWMPESSKEYGILVEARSSSTLQASAARGFSVDFQPPSMVVASAVPDTRTGYVSIYLRKIDDGLLDVESCALFRVVGGVSTLIADSVADGETVVDRYAPLNTQFSYMTVSSSAAGSVSQGLFPGSVDVRRFFIYCGDEVASGMFEADTSLSVTPTYELVKVAGRKYPLAIMGDAVSEPHRVKAVVEGREAAMRFYEAALSGRTLIYKSTHGQVFRCVGKLDMAPYLASADWWTVEMSIERIGGDAL